MPVLPYGDTSPHVSESAWIAPTAMVIGDVVVGDAASLFYGAVLRGDTDAIRIGEGSNLQDNVVVHCDRGSPATVGARVSVGHAAVLHGCTVEDDCLIGMGAIVMNGAVVGRESLVAAGAVVPQDAVIPPRSLVAGVPGKVRRELTDEEVESVRQNAVRYLEYANNHAQIGRGPS
ncbi:gamma carbonic anhydrase family protein [Lysobacter korlensis]|uniref:Gamma carbonic anhydrase family protein n=1 Tax=Lysobacter korlensis TaxID=553636 RepID=A0ABV6RNT4_9GAMM